MLFFTYLRHNSPAPMKILDPLRQLAAMFWYDLDKGLTDTKYSYCEFFDDRTTNLTDCFVLFVLDNIHLKRFHMSGV